jgi:hypothetical protein
MVVPQKRNHRGGLVGREPVVKRDPRGRSFAALRVDERRSEDD